MRYKREEEAKYKDMCAMAAEIQKRSPMCIVGVTGRFFLGLHYCQQNRFWITNPDIENLEKIWLPYQEQLQEMVIDKFPNYYPCSLYGMLLEFHFFTQRENRFALAKQLWLAFVMEKLQKKAWNGTAWEEGAPSIRNTP